MRDLSGDHDANSTLRRGCAAEEESGAAAVVTELFPVNKEMSSKVTTKHSKISKSKHIRNSYNRLEVNTSASVLDFLHSDFGDKRTPEIGLNTTAHIRS